MLFCLNGTIISNNKTLTLPFAFEKGNNSLELFLDGVRLQCATDNEDGHYKEYNPYRTRDTE